MIRKSVLLASVMALLLAACADGDAGTETTVPATLTTTSTEATTTTTAPTTTTVAETTTTVPATTTTAPATTTTMVDDTVLLSDEGLQVGADWVPFGSDDDDTIAKLTAALGAPADDTGWLDSATDGWDMFGVCPGPNVRAVSWGTGGNTSFQVMFTDADTDFWTGGVEHLYSFYYYGSSTPDDLETTEGITVGSSLGQLKAAYDPAKIEIGEAFFDPAVGYWTYDIATWTGLWGYATGQTDAHVITSINGGQGCGE